MSPVTACLFGLLTVGYLVVQHDASVLPDVQAEALEVDEAERTASAEDTIKAYTEEMETCVKSGSVDCIVAYYAEDVRLMRQGHPTEIGISGVGKVFTWIYAHDDATVTATEVIVPSDTYVMERIHIVGKYPNGTEAIQAKAVLFWKKVNNVYKIYIDIYNTNE